MFSKTNIFSIYLSLCAFPLFFPSLGSTHTWSGQQYSANKSIQFKGALDQLKGYSFLGTEEVLDIGSGDGEITSLIADLTQGEVIGLDVDSSMVQHAISKYKKKNLKFHLGDALELSNQNQFDLITSFNTIHWVQDQSRLLRRIRIALKPGGKILFGMPTILSDEEVGTSLMVRILRNLSQNPEWSPYLKNFKPPWNFFGRDEYEKFLKDANFSTVKVEITKKPFRLKNEQAFIGWMKQIVPHLKHIPSQLRDRFLQRVLQEYLKHVPLTDQGEVRLSHAQLEVSAERK